MTPSNYSNSEIQHNNNIPELLGSFFSHVYLFHLADHHVICLHTRNGIEILVTVAVQLSPDMVGYLYLKQIMLLYSKQHYTSSPARQRKVENLNSSK